MKKTALLFAFALIAFGSNAQLTLTGTSYTQNFDGLTSSLPTGWNTYNSATSTSLGSIDVTYGSGSASFGAYYDTTDCASSVFGHGFKNSASNDVAGMCTATCSVQAASPNRCLAVRQAGTSFPGSDPGASFALQLANTNGDSAFTLSFHLQSLDETSGRTTAWTLDYGIGATPTTFTAITPGAGDTMTTGGYTCANHTITATLPAAVNNQPSPVWIRISTLSASTGTGNRTTTGIDDFMLNWHTMARAGIASVGAPANLSLTVLGNPVTDQISLSYTTDAPGAYRLNIIDLTGRVLYASDINAQAGTNTENISGLRLAPGMYIARMSNSSSSSVARVIVQ